MPSRRLVTLLLRKVGTRLMSTSSPVPVKPPNVLVLQPSSTKSKKEGDSSSQQFSSLKKELLSCLNKERYVLYPLSVKDVLLTPWKENCSFLVIPCNVTAEASTVEGVESSWPDVLREMISYVHSGGVLLSMHSVLNTRLGFKPPSSLVWSHLCRVETSAHTASSGESIRFRTLTISAASTFGSDSTEKEMNPPVSIEDVAFPLPEDSENSLLSHQLSTTDFESGTELTDTSTDSSCISRQFPCIRKVKFEGGGQAILSYVDLFPEIHESLDVKTLVQVKEDTRDRAKFLRGLLGDIGLECGLEKVPDLTHTYLLCSEENRSKYLSIMAPLQANEGIIKGSEISLQLISNDFSKLGTPVDPLPQPSSSNLTVIARPAKWQVRSLPFDLDLYFEHLRTAHLGQTVLYTPVISSTQTVFTGNVTFCDALTTQLGVVCVAAQQTQGKGRSGNVWISPKGSMMFSTALKVTPTSHLYRRMPLLQHIVALSVVSAIRTIPGYEDVPVRIKWPNDIYYRDRVKLGGILVSCFSFGSDTTLTAVVGCGVNIANKYPTMSVNDSIALHNKETGGHLPPLSVELVLARTLNQLEMNLGQYEATGMKAVEKQYYKYWLHSGTTVKLASRGHEEVVIVGIDDYGYLRVQCKNRQELSLQPDGNTFDIMKGLIAMK